MTGESLYLMTLSGVAFSYLTFRSIITVKSQYDLIENMLVKKIQKKIHTKCSFLMDRFVKIRFLVANSMNFSTL